MRSNISLWISGRWTIVLARECELASHHTTSKRKPRIRSARQRGLSLVEMLISLAITAMLLTATMVAIDASFRAYAAAVESASTQTSTRLVTHRLLTLVRTSIAHGPTDIPAEHDPQPTYYLRPPNNQLDTSTLVSRYLQLIDADGRNIRIEYRPDDKQLWLITKVGSSEEQAQPLLDDVVDCTFYLHRRQDRDGVWVLRRASLDLTVDRRGGGDSTLAIENHHSQAVRYVASTMPRKLE